jgi:predicted amino acid dehydrogenase
LHDDCALLLAREREQYFPRAEESKILPYLSNRAPWFCFLVHLRDREDLYRLSESAFLRQYSLSEEDFEKKMCSIPPVVIGEVTFGFESIRGEIINVMRMPHAMAGLQGSRITSEAADVAVKRGARVIGLGALTSPASGGGLRLLPTVPSGTVLTNGNAYTASVVRANVIEASSAIGLDMDAHVAIVGCTGSVGVAATRLLASAGFEMTLVGRSKARVAQIFSQYVRRAHFADNVCDLGRADIVVLLTSDPSAELAIHHVKKEAVVIDCAQPPNVTKQRLPMFTERGIRVVKGGIVHIPGYSCSVDFGLPEPQATFACLAETYLFAKEGIHESSVGRPSEEFAIKMDEVARRRGVVPKSLALK